MSRNDATFPKRVFWLILSGDRTTSTTTTTSTNSPHCCIFCSHSPPTKRHFSFSVPFQNWSATFLTSPSYLRYDFSPEVKQGVGGLLSGWQSVWTLATSALNDYYYYYYLFGEGREIVPRVSKHFQIRNVAVRLYWKCPGPNNLCTVNLCVCNLQSTLDWTFIFLDPSS